MKKILSVLVAVFMIVSSFAMVSFADTNELGDEIILNYDFTDTLDSLGVRWWINADNSDSKLSKVLGTSWVDYDSAEGHNEAGSYCLNAGCYASIYLSTGIMEETTDTYRLGFWIKGKEGTIVTVDEETVNHNFGGSYTIKQDDTWEYVAFQHTFDGAPEGAEEPLNGYFFRIYYYYGQQTVAEEKTFWIDDVEFVKVADPTTTAEWMNPPEEETTTAEETTEGETTTKSDVTTEGETTTKSDVTTAGETTAAETTGETGNEGAFNPLYIALIAVAAVVVIAVVVIIIVKAKKK